MEFKPGDRVVGIDGWCKGMKGIIAKPYPNLLAVKFDDESRWKFEYIVAPDCVTLLDEFEEWVAEVRATKRRKDG